MTTTTSRPMGLEEISGAVGGNGEANGVTNNVTDRGPGGRFRAQPIPCSTSRKPKLPNADEMHELSIMIGKIAKCIHDGQIPYDSAMVQLGEIYKTKKT